METEDYYTLAEIRLICEWAVTEYGDDPKWRLDQIASLIDRKRPELRPLELTGETVDVGEDR
jgi:hypothetical protein